MIELKLSIDTPGGTLWCKDDIVAALATSTFAPNHKIVDSEGNEIGTWWLPGISNDG
jgi:hypothetical protein